MKEYLTRLWNLKVAWADGHLTRDTGIITTKYRFEATVHPARALVFWIVLRTLWKNRRHF